MDEGANKMFETEFKFTLPKGYLDMNGVLHREGVMRLANEGDEIIPLKEPPCSAESGVFVYHHTVTSHKKPRYTARCGYEGCGRAVYD